MGIIDHFSLKIMPLAERLTVFLQNEFNVIIFLENTRLNYILFTTKFSLQLSMLFSSRKERLCSPCKSLKRAIVIKLQLSWSNVFHHSSPIILSLLENISIGSLRKTSHSSFKICRKLLEKRKRFVPERPYNEGHKIFEKFQT